jgi:hypothetical protein
MTWWWCFVAGLLVVGLVVPPVGATAATIPALFVYDVAVQSTGTVQVEAGTSLRRDAEQAHLRVRQAFRAASRRWVAAVTQGFVALMANALNAGLRRGADTRWPGTARLSA